jgi:Na+(H+)/acetate symporter ActP
VALAGTLACVVPAGAWTLVVAALGLAASALAPAVVLACWSERATARGAVAGAGAGFVVFLLLALAGVLGPEGPAEGWGSVALAAPAIGAVPVHLAVAWILRLRRAPSTRSPLPPGLDGLSSAGSPAS